MEKTKREFACGVGVLYPAWIFYMQTTMSEALLNFLFILIIYLFLIFIENPRAVTAMLLAVTLIYIYSVHMRTVGLVIACMMTCVLWNFTKSGSRKQLLIFVMVLMAAGFVSLQLKEHTIFEVYTHAEQNSLAVNDYGSQWRKFSDLLTPQGSARLIESILGKLFYLGVSSFGIFYWGIGWCACKSVSLIKALHRKDKVSYEHWLAFFLFWASVGEVLISSIYMYQPSGIDGLIYGRYTELLIPAMLLLGIAVMERSRFLFPVTLLNGVVSGGVLLFLLDVIEKRKLRGLRGYHIAGLSYLIDESNLDEILFFRNTWVLGFGVMLLVSIFVWLGKRWNNGWLLAGVLVIEILAGIQISHHYTYRVNNILFENQVIAEIIGENFDTQDQIYYLDEGNGAFIDFLQMQMPDKPIHILDGQENVTAQEKLFCSGGFLITDAKTPNDRYLQKLFDERIATNMFSLYFNSKS